MKLFPKPRAGAAFTLVEMMVSAALFSLVILGFLGAYMSSLEFTEFVRPKVQNTQYARETLGPLIEEIRSANSVQVGTGTVSSFVLAASGKPQAGNAIRIYPTTNMSQYIYYFQDVTNKAFRKVPLNNSNAVLTVATSVTNAYPFTMETFTGSLLTNSQNNSVLSILLQMRRDSSISGMSDNYQIRSKLSRRNIL